MKSNGSIFITVMGILCVALLAFGCEPAGDVSTIEPEAEDVGQDREPSAFSGVAYLGEVTLPELALGSEVIARVRFNSAQQTIEMLTYSHPDDSTANFYAGALVITFDVQEYLKGSGGTQIRAVLIDGDGLRNTEAEARAAAGDLHAFRDKKYDDRDAIVFLAKAPLVPRTQQVSDLYYLSFLRAGGEHAYTVDSRWAKAWLPAAAPPSTRGRAAGASGNTQRFLTNVPDGANGISSGGVNVRGTSGQSGTQQESMTLGELKTFIADLEAQVTAGGGTDRYRECLMNKHQNDSWIKAAREAAKEAGRSWKKQRARGLASGSPAGSEAYEGGKMLYLSDTDKANEPTWSDIAVVKSGPDAELFNHTWPLKATTTRPLPAGEYRFYWAEQGDGTALCGGLPEALKTRDEVVLTVIALNGTLHEAFFDPVALGSAVGADGTNGVISAAELTVGNTSTSISGLKWDNNQVVLSWSSHTGLGGYKLDFIELDGTASLSLDAASATEDSAAKTLTWNVPSQPWHDGDLLMVRFTPSLEVTVSADNLSPAAAQPALLTPAISNAPPGPGPSYDWQLDFGSGRWLSASSNSTLSYLGNAGESIGFRVVVKYGSGVGATSETVTISWP